LLFGIARLGLVITLKLPVDVKSVTFVLDGVSTRVDFDTKQPSLDADGRPLFNVSVFARTATDDRSAPLLVVVPGPVSEIPALSAVTFDGLVASTWDNRSTGKSGVSFRASKLVKAPGA